MFRHITLLAALVLATVVASSFCNAFSTSSSNISHLQYVDTRIGTAGGGWGIGQLPPGPQVPYGAMRLGPDTSNGLEPLRLPFEAFGGYYYPSEWIECFSHTHMVGAGIGDFQNFGVMLTRRWDNTVVKDAGYKSKYTHDQEIAVPGYYAVELQSSNTYAEMTVSGTHSGIHRYTCRGGSSSSPCVLVIDMCHVAVKGGGLLDFESGCKEAQITTLATVSGNSSSSSSSSPKTVMSGWIFNNGDMTGRSPRGGINIYFHAIIEVQDKSTGAIIVPQHATWTNGSIDVNNGPNFNSTRTHSLGAGFIVNSTSSGNDGDVVVVVFTVRVGISFISATLAENNLMIQQQSPSSSSSSWMSFDECKTQTQAKWNALLSRISVNPSSSPSSSSVANLTSFYSSIYRAHLAPTIYTETDGTYLGMDNQLHNSTGFNFVSDLSIWDVYRTQAPMLLFTDPAMAHSLTLSMLNIYNQQGELPVWTLANVETHCMVGHHSAVIFTDYLLKGIQGLNSSSSSSTSSNVKSQIFEAIVQGIGAQSKASLSQHGYVPQGPHGGCSASLTEDFSLDAGAVYHLAKFLGNTSVASQFYSWSQSYRNEWNNETNYICPRTADGSWICPSWPSEPYPFTKNYTEGNAAQYRWYIPHDVRGLVSLFPSKSVYASELNSFFADSMLWPFNTTLPNWQFWAGNEPSLLTPVMFPFAGNEYAHLTSYWFPKMLAEYYYPDPAGVPGNDDYGAMSAWLIFGYLGFYPVASTSEYVLFAPQFDDVTVRIPKSGTAFSPWKDKIHWESGNSSSGSSSSSSDDDVILMRLKAYNRPTTTTSCVYLANASINGKPLTSTIFSHELLMETQSGGQPVTIEFYLSAEPTVFGMPAPRDGGPKPFQPKNTRKGRGSRTGGHGSKKTQQKQEEKGEEELEGSVKKMMMMMATGANGGDIGRVINGEKNRI